MSLPALVVAFAAVAHWLGTASVSLHPVRFEAACQALACRAFTFVIEPTRKDS